jgi:hypothetical protein
MNGILAPVKEASTVINIRTVVAVFMNLPVYKQMAQPVEVEKTISEVRI